MSNLYMKNASRLVVLVLLGWQLSSCYYDKADIVYPSAGTCDTTAATFSAKVLPLMNTNCNVCHGGTASAGAGIKLDTYTGVRAQLTAGRLLGSLQHQSGFSAMPKGGTKLSDCNIAIIKAWVNAGALNN
ncbi:MAG: cytochrome c [Chitinophagaceae bacterium]|nr:cytochrome c [Chitinophagaceae bacterium]